jgi:hypothetical protein
MVHRWVPRLVAVDANDGNGRLASEPETNHNRSAYIHGSNPAPVEYSDRTMPHLAEPP